MSRALLDTLMAAPYVARFGVRRVPIRLGRQLLDATAQAEELLKDGLHTSEVIEGYNKANAMALEHLESLVLPGSDKVDVRDLEAVTKRLKCTIASKQYGFEDVLAPLVAKAGANALVAGSAIFGKAENGSYRAPIEALRAGEE